MEPLEARRLLAWAPSSSLHVGFTMTVTAGSAPLAPGPYNVSTSPDGYYNVDKPAVPVRQAFNGITSFGGIQYVADRVSGGTCSYAASSARRARIVFHDADGLMGTMQIVFTSSTRGTFTLSDVAGTHSETGIIFAVTKPVEQDFGAVLSDAGVLTVPGTAQKDAIELVAQGGQLTAIRWSPTGFLAQAFPLAAVRHIEIALGSGNDTLWAARGVPPIHCTGGTGNDVMTGSDGNDVFNGGPGQNNLMGDTGDDVLIGGDDADTLEGGPGNDLIIGHDGANTLFGTGTPRDLNVAEVDGNNTIFGGDGEDFIDGGDANDLIYGGAGDDFLIGGDGQNQIFAGDGNDDVRGGEGDDVIYGDAGIDTINGFGGADRLFGGSGNDQLFGGFGKDKLYGEAGNDRLFGEGHHDFINGGSGTDTAILDPDETSTDIEKFA